MTPNAPSDTTIRPAIRADLPRLGRLGALLVDEHHGFDERRFIPTRERTPADYASFLIRQLDDPKSIVLVADDHGDVIGYVYATDEGHDYMSLRGPAGVLQDILVAPEFRRRGVGEQLLTAAIDTLRARGISQIVLSTAERNAEAQRLFARAGFRRTMVEMTRDFGRDAEG
ncbi:MAG: GNAT family N-acetyltransferase [Gemmatimonadaceae bacterium]|nr:GNAT family N-acetyltransferase [Gemmatimonadaceae bacterium]